ncbi:nitrogen regulation protein NR(II) [Thermodesulfobacteriota bacterium]
MDNNEASKDFNAERIKLLEEAFASFNTATLELQQSYDELKDQFENLNIELEETNKKLTKNLIEKQELEEYLKNILNNAPNGVLALDGSGYVKSFNKAAEEITGYSFDDVRDMDIQELIPKINPKKKNNAIIFLDSVKFECKNKEEKILNIYISDMNDRDGGCIGKVVAIEDITSIRRLEEQVQRKNRLEAMGEMAAGISHEIRNPLGAIELFASMLKKDLQGDSEKEELVDNIVSGVKSLTNITSNLLLFTKDIRPKLEIIDIVDAIENALIFTEHLAKDKKINIVKDYSAQSRMISADAELLKQVFLNLVLNAVQALKKGGEIKISISEGISASPISIEEEKKFIRVTVEDSGDGIKRENVERVFNPFFTTKRSGLGIGLAIVHKIITSHNGMIEVASKEGSGATFTVTLPLAVQ